MVREKDFVSALFLRLDIGAAAARVPSKSYSQSKKPLDKPLFLWYI
jgi:hypothetical protein